MKVLIAGASGLVGKRLTDLLIADGHEVAHLGRMKTRDNRVTHFTWNPGKGNIDTGTTEWCDAIVNLSGSNVGEGRWTEARKKVIVDSRVKSLQLLAKSIANEKTKPKVLISASGVGYYGLVTNDHVYTEKDPAANDFFGQCCKQWEKAADLVEEIGVRCVKMRMGAVLSKDGGALARLLPVVQWYLGAPIGNGKQSFPWIHIDDLCRFIIFALKQEDISGVYNLVATEQVTNRQFMKALGKAAHRPVFFPPVPGFMLRFFLGEMAGIILQGSRISNEKLKRTGFHLKYDCLQSALEKIFAG